MEPEILKTTKRNKCDYCDDLAKFKIKEKITDPYFYICKACYKDLQKQSKIL